MSYFQYVSYSHTAPDNPSVIEVGRGVIKNM